MSSIGELRRRTIEALTKPSYSIAGNGMVLLNDNANLFGANPAIEEVAESFDFGRLSSYPSESSQSLRERIASEFGVSPDEIMVGNGSDEILDIAAKCFLDPGDVFCSPTPTFSMYKFYANLHLARTVEKVLGRDFSLPADAILEERSKMISICQPNNPTANLFDPAEVRKLLVQAPGVVMIDEAYSEFAGTSMLKDVMDSQRGIDVRTLSKAYGVAGLRVGFAIARKEIVDELRQFRTPFGLNSFSEAVAVKALDNRDWVASVVSSVRTEGSYLRPKLESLGFKVYPSTCNFLLCKSPVEGPALVSALRARGVAIRDLNPYPLMANHVRVTIGPRPMLDKLLDRLESYLAGVSR
jgi:histidinol-phosphate aminotransferase